MKKQFENFINKRVKNPRENEVQEILSIFYEKDFNKRELFKQGNSMIKYLGFLVNGSARTYFINEKGNEITNEIILKNNFLTESVNIKTNENSPIIIEILEKSTVLVADIEKVWILFEKNLTFNIFIREYIGDRSLALLKKYLLFLNSSANERYKYIMDTNPEIIKKFPLKYIASMIGVTQTQLSRIRKDIS